MFNELQKEKLKYIWSVRILFFEKQKNNCKKASLTVIWIEIFIFISDYVSRLGAGVENFFTHFTHHETQKFIKYNIKE